MSLPKIIQFLERRMILHTTNQHTHYIQITFMEYYLHWNIKCSSGVQLIQFLVLYVFLFTGPWFLYRLFIIFFFIFLNQPKNFDCFSFFFFFCFYVWFFAIPNSHTEFEIRIRCVLLFTFFFHFS